MYEDEQDLNLPQVAPSHVRRKASENALRATLEPQFGIRLEREDDYGADGSIELRYPGSTGDRYLSSGRRAWFQLKSTAHDDPRYAMETKNINYLAQHVCPIYLLYLHATGQIYFRWLRDICAELDQNRPAWRTQDSVMVSFSRLLDPSAFAEIALEIASTARQILTLRDGPRFRRAVDARIAKELLNPDSTFFGRAEAIGALRANISRASVQTIRGLPRSGKTELIRQYLCDPATIERLRDSLGSSVAYLHVDAAEHVEPRLLRGLAFALGVHKVHQAAADNAAWQPEQRGILFGEDLPIRLQGQALVAFLDSLHLCLDDAREREDLDLLLSADAFRTGCAIVGACWGTPPTGKGRRSVQPIIALEPLQSSDAVSLLTAAGVDATVAAHTIIDAQVVQELLLPGVLRHGAAQFRAHVAEGLISPSRDACLNELIAAAAHITTEILTSLGLVRSQSAEHRAQPLDTLLALAVVGDVGVSLDGLRAARLPELPQAALTNVGWLQPSTTEYRLTSFAVRCLRPEVQRVLKDTQAGTDNVGTLAQVLDTLLTVVEAETTEDQEDGTAHSVEASLAWVRRSGMSNGALDRLLTRRHVLYAGDDTFFPLHLEQATLSPGSASANQDLDSALAAVVVATRTGSDADDLVPKLRAAVTAAAVSHRLLALHVRLLDLSAFLGERNHRLQPGLLETRHRLVPRLSELSVSETSDAGVLKWTVSWLLNTARMTAAAERADEARQLLALAGAYLQRMPAPRSPRELAGKTWLESRLAHLESLLATADDARTKHLKRAMELAFAIMAAEPVSERWTGFAFRSAQRFLDDLRTDDARVAFDAAVLARVESVYGESAAWPLAVRTRMAALHRDVGGACFDPMIRVSNVKAGIRLLREASTEIRRLARLGDIRSLLTLARCHALLAACNAESSDEPGSKRSLVEALRVLEGAVPSVLSPDGWELYLRLTDQLHEPQSSGRWHADPCSEEGPVPGERLKSAMNQVGTWLKKCPSWGETEGRVALWCLQRKWQAEGSLERLAASATASEDWQSLDPQEKVRHIKNLYRARHDALGVIERRSGPFVDIYLARVRNEAQFQRLVAMHRHQDPEAAPIMRHFTAARSHWPDNHLLLKQEGRFHRYVWNYPSAIVSFRKAVHRATGGADRREVIVDLVETLLTAATHIDSIRLADGTVLNRADMVREARDMLADLIGFRHISREVALLRDRADLEADSPVDWGSVDAAFASVVGDVDAYVPTLIQHLDKLNAGKDERPFDLAGLVLSNFTSADALSGLGSLYLRRFELGHSTDGWLDVRRAYAAFQACRLLEIAWLRGGKESSPTSYLRARTLLAAAQLTGELTPLKIELEGKKNGVRLAQALFQRVQDLSVGLFRAEARRRSADAARLAARLESGGGL